MNVSIRVIKGAYRDASWVGRLTDAPVTMLIPEGIVSARTTDEADKMRASVSDLLTSDDDLDAVDVTAIGWAIRVRRLAIGCTCGHGFGEHMPSCDLAVKS